MLHGGDFLLDFPGTCPLLRGGPSRASLCCSWRCAGQVRARPLAVRAAAAPVPGGCAGAPAWAWNSWSREPASA